jgi:hypothetical protein
MFSMLSFTLSLCEILAKIHKHMNIIVILLNIMSSLVIIENFNVLAKNNSMTIFFSRI